MGKDIHKGGSPKNARIKINYEGKKPTVRFSYPSKNTQVEGGMFNIIFVFYFLLILGSYYFYYSGLIFQKDVYDKELYNECLKNENFAIRVNCFPLYLEEQESDFAMNRLLILFKLLGAALILSLLTYFPFKKRFWSDVYPKYMAFMARKKIKIFDSEDVIYDKEKGYYCELPVFSNIILDFKATKDFSRYLREMEIEEHKFKYYRPYVRRRKSLKKKRKMRKGIVNEWLWYARFYLSEKPKIGKLEVIFK